MTACSAKPVRIVALGDCNTHTGDPNQGTVPAGLAWALGNYGLETQVANLGGGMETCREGLARLLNNPTQADIAVINYGLVDAWTTSIPQIYVPYYPDNRLRKTCRKLLKFTKRRLLTKPLRKLLPNGPVVGEDEFVSKIGQMIGALREQNSSINVFLWGTVPVSNHPARNIPLFKYNKLLRGIAETHAVDFVNSESLLEQIPSGQRHLDGVHISKAVAKAIGSEICSRHLKICETANRHVA